MEYRPVPARTASLGRWDRHEKGFIAIERAHTQLLGKSFEGKQIGQFQIHHLREAAFPQSGRAEPAGYPTFDSPRKGEIKLENRAFSLSEENGLGLRAIGSARSRIRPNAVALVVFSGS